MSLSIWRPGWKTTRIMVYSSWIHFQRRCYILWSCIKLQIFWQAEGGKTETPTWKKRKCDRAYCELVLHFPNHLLAISRSLLLALLQWSRQNRWFKWLVAKHIDRTHPNGPFVHRLETPCSLPSSVTFTSSIVKIPTSGGSHFTFGIVRETVEIGKVFGTREFHQWLIHVMSVFVALNDKRDTLKMTADDTELWAGCS